MLNESYLKTKYSNQAILIGDQILNEIKTDSDGYFWETHEIRAGIIVKEATYDLYSGTSGILLFLLELYEYTGDQKFLPFLKGAGNWLYNKIAKDQGNLSFYNGRLGAIYVLMILSDVINDKTLEKKCLPLLKKIEFNFGEKFQNCDLLGGVAGILQGLLLIYDRRPTKGLLLKIERFIAYLLENAFVGEKGVFWNLNGNQISGLCGVSHGSSGIGMILCELGVYFKNDMLIQIGASAFEYENSHYDHNEKNWPDFRLAIYTQAEHDLHLEKIKVNDLAFFEAKSGHMSAWCHGAPGALLARFRLLNLGVKPLKVFNDYTEESIGKIKLDLRSLDYKASSTICHGYLGIGLTLLECYKYLDDSSYSSLAKKLADQSIESKKEFGYYVSGLNIHPIEDLSFFNGISGIGYFYLLLAKDVNSVFSPNFVNNSSSALTLKNQDYLELFLNAVVPKTMYLIKKIFLKSLSLQDFQGHLSVRALLRYYLSNINALSVGMKEVVDDVLKLELTLLRKLNEIKSFAFIKSHKLFASKDCMETISNLDLIRLKINPLDSIHFSKWRWDVKKPNANLKKRKGKHGLLIRKEEVGCRSYFVSDFVYNILFLCESSKRLDEIFDGLMDVYFVEDENMLKDKLRKQLTELVKIEVLIPCF